MLDGSGRRPFPSQVCGHCLCNCRQQRKLDRHIGLRPADPQYSALPVHILQSNSQGLRLRPDHTSPTATRSHSHVCPALPFERSNAESSARRSTANSVGAAHLSDIAVQSPHWRDQPSIFLLCAEIGETPRSELQVSATVRLERRVASFRTKASTSANLALAMVLLPLRSCSRKPRAVSTSRTSVRSETPLWARR